MILENQAHLYELDSSHCYLNCAYFSPQLKSVTEIGMKSLVKKSTPWTMPVTDFYEPVEDCRKAISKLVGCSMDNVALSPSVSYSLALASKNICLERGSKILLLEEQFPSNVYVWLQKAKDEELEVEFVSHGKSWTESILQILSDSRNIGMIALGQVHWTDGEWIDLVQISSICKEKGVVLVVDATQSMGACVFPYDEIQPDFLAVGGYKWLQGPYGMGFVVVADKYLEGSPLEWNWINRSDSENFHSLVDYRETYQSGARRFDLGGKSQFILVPMFTKALDQVLSWGVENIAETLRDYNQSLHEGIHHLGLKTQKENCRSPHLLGIYEGESRFKDGLAEYLKENKVHVSFRGSSIRVSPYLYNSSRDKERFLQVLEGALK